MNFSYAPARTLNFLSPNVFGNPGDGSYLTEGAFFEDAVYIGLLPLIAAVAAVLAWIVRGIRSLRRSATADSHKTIQNISPEVDEIPVFTRVGSDGYGHSDQGLFLGSVPFWLVVVIVGYVFALGQNTPIFPFLFNNIPTFDLFQAPVRWHVWTVFGLSVLAGIGTQSWGRGHWLFFWTRLAVAGCIGAALLAWFVAPRVLDVGSNQSIGVLIAAVVLTGILGAVAGILTLLQPDGESRRYTWWGLVVLVFLAADLGWAARGLNPTVTAEFYDRLPAAEADVSRAYWPEEIDDNLKYNTYLLFDDYRVATEGWKDFRRSGLDNLNLLDRQYLLNNFDPLRVGHFVDYVNLIEANPEHQNGLLQAASVQDVYNENAENRVFDLPTARAWFSEGICWHTSDVALSEALLNDSWQPLRQVHILGDAGCPDLPPDALIWGQVLDLQDRGNSVVVDVDTQTGGLLVLADTDYPAWTATVDGVPTRILRANLAFRAVEVPAGTKQVEFVYRPGWLLPGVLVSIIALLVMLLLFRSQNPNRAKP
jgi:hypothetical protein